MSGIPFFDLDEVPKELLDCFDEIEVACGKPWARVVSESDYEPEEVVAGVRNVDESRGDKTRKISGKEYSEQKQTTTIGWRATCRCPEHEPRPAMVLDPFAGSGRTGVTAQRMFLDFTGIELNEAYWRMATKIMRDDCPLFSGADQ